MSAKVGGTAIKTTQYVSTICSSINSYFASNELKRIPLQFKLPADHPVLPKYPLGSFVNKFKLNKKYWGPYRNVILSTSKIDELSVFDEEAVGAENGGRAFDSTSDRAWYIKSICWAIDLYHGAQGPVMRRDFKIPAGDSIYPCYMKSFPLGDFVGKFKRNPRFWGAYRSRIRSCCRIDGLVLEEPAAAATGPAELDELFLRKICEGIDAYHASVDSTTIPVDYRVPCAAVVRSDTHAGGKGVFPEDLQHFPLGEFVRKFHGGDGGEYKLTARSRAFLARNSRVASLRVADGAEGPRAAADAGAVDAEEASSGLAETGDTSLSVEQVVELFAIYRDRTGDTFLCESFVIPPPVHPDVGGAAAADATSGAAQEAQYYPPHSWGFRLGYHAVRLLKAQQQGTLEGNKERGRWAAVHRWQASLLGELLRQELIVPCLEDYLQRQRELVALCVEAFYEHHGIRGDGTVGSRIAQLSRVETVPLLPADARTGLDGGGPRYPLCCQGLRVGHYVRVARLGEGSGSGQGFELSELLKERGLW